jgi:hypothetical protein
MSDSFFPFEVETSFGVRDIPASATLEGVALGQGECVAVRLYLNQKVDDTATNTNRAANLLVIWFGDAQQQKHELQAGVFSHIIYCRDLQDVFVRGNGVANEVQFWVYTKK